jgi:hypothetical protein
MKRGRAVKIFSIEVTNDRSGLDPNGMGKNIRMRLKLYQENRREEAEAVEYHTRT